MSGASPSVLSKIIYLPQGRTIRLDSTASPDIGRIYTDDISVCDFIIVRKRLSDGTYRISATHADIANTIDEIRSELDWLAEKPGDLEESFILRKSAHGISPLSVELEGSGFTIYNVEKDFFGFSFPIQPTKAMDFSLHKHSEIPVYETHPDCLKMILCHKSLLAQGRPRTFPFTRCVFLNGWKPLFSSEMMCPIQDMEDFTKDSFVRLVLLFASSEKRKGMRTTGTPIPQDIELMLTVIAFQENFDSKKMLMRIVTPEDTTLVSLFELMRKKTRALTNVLCVNKICELLLSNTESWDNRKFFHILAENYPPIKALPSESPLEIYFNGLMTHAIRYVSKQIYGGILVAPSPSIPPLGSVPLSEVVSVSGGSCFSHHSGSDLANSAAVTVLFNSMKIAEPPTSASPMLFYGKEDVVSPSLGFREVFVTGVRDAITDWDHAHIIKTSNEKIYLERLQAIDPEKMSTDEYFSALRAQFKEASIPTGINPLIQAVVTLMKAYNEGKKTESTAVPESK